MDQACFLQTQKPDLFSNLLFFDNHREFSQNMIFHQLYKLV